MGRLYLFLDKASKGTSSVVTALVQLLTTGFPWQTLQAHAGFNVVPRKLIVAKRLAQCLNPALPSGVHQKVLEVYEQILTQIGKEGLRRDLQVWTPGLFPFFQFASTKAKPQVLDILEQFYLPLHDDLRPVGKAVLLALLPGLEEESGEFFDRTLRILDQVSTSVSQTFFLENIWLIMRTTASARLPALNYLARRLPKLTTLGGAEATRVVGRDLGLMTSAFVAALRDDALLTRRVALDLLVTHLPMHSPVFSKVIRPEQQTSLVSAAIAVVLRRDLSLNRRLYSWLLGPEDDNQVDYLNKYSLEHVRMALISGLAKHGEAGADNADPQEPYRVFISLQDKWEIGQPLSNVIILDILSSLQKASKGSDSATLAKMLFDVVDPFVMYRQFYFALKHDIDPEVHAANQKSSSPRTVGAEKDSAMDLMGYVLSTFPITDEEARHVHLPALFAAISTMLLKGIDATKMPAARRYDAYIGLLSEILDLIPNSAFKPNADAADPSADLTGMIETFYSSTQLLADQSARLHRQLLSSYHITDTLRLLKSLSVGIAERPQKARAREPSLRLISAAFAKLPRLDAHSVDVPCTIDFDAQAYLQVTLATIGASHSTIPDHPPPPPWAVSEIEAALASLVACSNCSALQTPLRIENGQDASFLIDKVSALGRGAVNLD